MALDKRKFSKAVKDKYLFENETFKRVAKANPKDKIDVEIGDSKQPDFKPQVKVQRWDNEVNLSFRLKDDGVEEEIVETKSEEIVWKKGKREAHFYDLPESETLPEGGYEFEVILLEKPATNVVEFSLNTKGLDFFYQPALTPEEIAEGASRPENVVGSYAVYASDQKRNYVGGKEYKCGKVGHIYRPQIEDANGVKVWGELNVDTVNGILSVTIPQDFLDNAVYPVRHAAGLTFGYTSVGANQANSTLSEDALLTIYPIAESGDVSKLTYYTKSFSGTINTKGLIYDDDGASAYPGTLMGTSDVFAPDTTFGWDDFTFSSSVALTAGNWWIGIAASASSVYNAWDTGSTNQTMALTSSSAYTTPPNPFTAGASGLNRKVSIYATYTATGTFPVIESVTDTDFGTSVTSMAVNMPATVNSGDRLIALVHYRNAGTWTTVPTGWSNLAEQAGGGAVGEMAIFEKVADGTEDGGTATWITGTGTTAAWQVLRISGAHASTASEVTTTSGDSSSANPPSETASWGAENNLWLAVAGHSAASAAAFSAEPSGFTGFAQNGASSGGSACSIAHGYNRSAVATYDPGTFTTSGSNRWWAAATIVVRPAAAGGGGGSATPTLMLMGMGT